MIQGQNIVRNDGQNNLDIKIAFFLHAQSVVVVFVRRLDTITLTVEKQTDFIAQVSIHSKISSLCVYIF